MTMFRVGEEVTTPEGVGTIVGKDLPDHECWRWKVRLDATGKVRCYWQRDIRSMEAEGGRRRTVPPHTNKYSAGYFGWAMR